MNTDVCVVNVQTGLAPAYGSVARYQVVNVLSWVGTELHGSIGGLFAPNSEEVKKTIRAKGAKNLKYVYPNTCLLPWLALA
jgi:hypothetical protein